MKYGEVPHLSRELSRDHGPRLKLRSDRASDHRGMLSDKEDPEENVTEAENQGSDVDPVPCRLEVVATAETKQPTARILYLLISS